MWRKREIGKMMTKNEVIKLALDALGPTPPDCCGCQAEWQIAIDAIKTALEAKDEPVAWMYEVNHAHTCLDLFEPPDDAYDEGTLYPLYTTPPQRTWVGLTDEEIKAFDTWHDNREEEIGWVNPSEIVAYIEAKLKEKNT